nr:putative RNA polymerase II subunit B1 CTD phosphatase RPAP2 homolog [Tanacetum cinerariifolium]
MITYSALREESDFDTINESIDGDHAFRLASAEACAEALKQAAEAVASGEFYAPDAVSEAGLVILPPSHDDNEVVSEGTVDPEPAPVKWPQKTGIVEADFLDSDDSWFDSPPEEFVLDLSPFGTMFMSLFAWVSSSTLAYVYGRDDSFHEDYASVNGREYPQKIVLTDGRSSEIRQTLASTVELGLGSLIETMSFLDALPGLRMKQWKVFVLLFIEGLSVCRIPAIAPHLTNKRSFFQKVFADGQISREEYEFRARTEFTRSGSKCEQRVIELRKSQEGLETTMTDEEILAEVFGISRGFNPGRSKKLSGTSSPSSFYSAHSHHPEPVMTQAQLAKYVAASNQQIATVYADLRANNTNIPPFILLYVNQYLNADEDDHHPEDE